MSKIKILVVEDEIIIADHLCDTLEELGYEVLEPAINYTEALILIQQENLDLAILDIQLSGKKTGLDIAKEIQKTKNFPFIFLTSNADSGTVELAKKVKPAAFLVKPFTKKELFTSIEIALSNFNEQKIEKELETTNSKDAIFIKDKGVFLKVRFDEILYIKSDHVYIEIFLKNGNKYLVRNSLKEVLKTLNDTFLQVHRGYVINTMYLSQVNRFSVNIEGEAENIPVGKKHKEDLLRKLKLL